MILKRAYIKNMRSFVSPKIKKRKSKNGYGLFAMEAVPAGTIVVDFSTGPGTYTDTAKVDKMYDNGHDYGLQIDDNLFFAAVKDGELEDADFLNHSCDPNCGIKEKLKIVALRYIPKNEEITFDYAMCESSNFNMPCECESEHCRKIITGNDWKLPELQKKYKGFFSDYLQKKINS